MDRRQQLLAEGFEKCASKSVALPHTVWKLDIEVEFDRSLTLAEETILRLIEAGVSDPEQIAQLMGVDPGVIVPATIVALLSKGLLGQIERLTIMPLGKQALRDQRVKTSQTYEDVEVRHDPYEDGFLWKYDAEEFKVARAVRDEGLEALPLVRELKGLEVEVRHAEIQSLLDRFGMPFETEEDRKKHSTRDITRVRAKHSYQAWRPAELEVWFNKERQEWDWRLLYQGGEDQHISAVLRQMRADGIEILPLEDRPRDVPAGPVGEQLHQAVEVASQAPRSALLQTEEHRDALREAILDARRELIVVSPWLTTAAVDGELLGWLDQALKKHHDLRVVVGYGIEQDAGQQNRKAYDQRQAIRRLNTLGNRHRGRLETIEIGHTHEKVVICDRRYAIVTSFNWLSFNPKPGKGIRRETGYRVEDPAAVEDLRRRLAPELKLKED